MSSIAVVGSSSKGNDCYRRGASKNGGGAESKSSCSCSINSEGSVMCQLMNYPSFSKYFSAAYQSYTGKMKLLGPKLRGIRRWLI